MTGIDVEEVPEVRALLVVHRVNRALDDGLAGRCWYVPRGAQVPRIRKIGANSAFR
jgi:hypothetical protein